MKQRLLYWGVIVLTLTALVTGNAKESFAKKVPVAKNGVIDLTGWDFQKDGPVPLSGQWELYWNQLLTPGDFDPSSPPAPDAMMPVPGSWKGIKVKGNPLGGQGYATLRLTILHGPVQVPLALKISKATNSLRLFAQDQQIARSGTPGTSKASARPSVHSMVADVAPGQDKTVLVLQIANFHEPEGGMHDQLLLGTSTDIRMLRDKRVALDLFLFGSIIIMGLYHLILFALRTKDRSVLYFGIFCLLIAARTIAFGESFIVDLLPAIPFWLTKKMEYVPFYAGVPIFFMFIYELFPKDFSTWVIRALMSIFGLFSAIAILGPTLWYTSILSGVQICTVIFSLYLIAVLAMATWRKREGAVVFVTGFLVFFLAMVHDMVNSAGLQLAGMGFFVFLLCQASVISMRFSRAFTAIEAQSRLIQAMARDIAQGTGDLTQRLPERGSGEVLALAEWFNNFIGYLQGMIKELVSNASTLSGASDELTDLSDMLSEGAEQMSTRSNSVALAADGMRDKMTASAAATGQASSNINAMASAAEEMTATINEIAQNSEKARQITSDAVRQAQSASQRIGELGNAAMEVGKVTEAITEISEQTNLLALNATIESARAGEAGKGFAVVANEIKELANQTARATKEIKAKIDSIQGSTAGTVKEVEQISTIIHDVDALVSTIATAVEEQSVTAREIAGNVSQVAGGIGEVNANVSESSRVSDEIAGDIAEVNRAAGDVTNSGAQLKMSAESLSNLAAQLKDKVSKFKT